MDIDWAGIGLGKLCLYAALFVMSASPAHAQVFDSDPDGSESEQIIRAVSEQLRRMRQEIAGIRSVVQDQEDQISRLEQRMNQIHIELSRELLTFREQLAGDNVAQSIESPDTSLGIPASADFRTRLQSALGFVESGQTRIAQNMLSELLLLEPENPDAPLAWYWLGEMHLQARQFQDAEQAFSYLIAVYENHWRVPASAFKLGEVFRLQEQQQRARVQYSRVVERYPDSPAARLSALALDALTSP
ncbi:MAG: tetratricopeptide repeat protein [Gammaproteobacteria bacterium]